MFAAEQNQLRTLGEVARLLDVPFHRASYAVGAYRIQETARVGIIRVFDETKVNLIRGVLKRIAERRGDCA